MPFSTRSAQKLPRSMAAERKEKILSAWRDLFSPVVEYLQGGTAGQRVSERPSSIPACSLCCVRFMVFHSRSRRITPRNAESAAARRQ